MIKNDKVPRSGQMSYNLDIDDIKIVPECTAKNDKEESKPSTEHEYESPLVSMFNERLATPDNARTRKESAQSSGGNRGRRCKDNVIYDSFSGGLNYEETEITGRRYTGYSYASTTLQECPSPVETDAFCFVNPVSISITDEEIYSKPYADDGQTNEPRARENKIYERIAAERENWKSLTASSAFSLQSQGAQNQLGITKHNRSQRWITWTIGILLIVSCTAFAIACLAYLNSNKALSNDNQLNKSNQLNKPAATDTFQSDKDNQTSTVSPPLYNSKSIQENSVLFKNFSKLLANFNDLKKKIEQDNLRFSKMNVSFWKQLKAGVFRGPRGHNGTRGRPGPQGEQGPRGILIKNFTCQSGNKSSTLDDRKITVIENETARKIFFDVSCETNIIDATHDMSPKINNRRYECTCKDVNRKRSRMMTCIMKYVVCTPL